MVDTELKRAGIAPSSPELNIQSVPDDRETVIQSCYELLCSGRALSEVLDEAKRLSNLSRGGRLDITGEPDNAAVAEEAPEPGAPPLLTPTPSCLVYHSRTSLNPAAFRFAWPLRSLRAKIVVLTVAFTLASVFTYVEFGKAHQNSQDALLQMARDKGQELNQSLLPMLENATIDDLPQLSRQLDRFAGRVTTIKLLLATIGSDNEKFYYAGSWPVSALEVARQTLSNQGVLDRLPDSCRAHTPFALIYDRPIGGAEIIAVTPISTTVGCWAVVTTFSADALTARIRE